MRAFFDVFSVKKHRFALFFPLILAFALVWSAINGATVHFHQKNQTVHKIFAVFFPVFQSVDDFCLTIQTS